jgi:alkyl hydroperoxide reductase subunit AhpF
MRWASSASTATACTNLIELQRLSCIDDTIHPAGKRFSGKIHPSCKIRHSFIITDGTLMTSIPGLFAAGDVHAGSTKQAVSAAGEDATAALMIRNCLRKL